MCLPCGNIGGDDRPGWGQHYQQCVFVPLNELDGRHEGSGPSRWDNSGYRQKQFNINLETAHP